MQEVINYFSKWWVEPLLLLTVMVILAWGWGILCSRLQRRDSNLGSMIRATSVPVMLMIVGLGTLQIIYNPINHFWQWGENNYSSWRTGIIVIGIFWMLLRLTATGEKLYNRQNLKIGNMPLEPTMISSSFRVGRYIILVVGALTLMESLGFSISGLLAFGGIGGAVVAFAAKDTLSNFFSGIMIFTERPFVAGDWIRCPGTDVEGVVEDIGWRITRLRTFDQRPLYVPNSMFSVNIIENPQRMTNRRIYEYCGLQYDDIGKMPAVLADIRTMLKTHDDIDQAQIQMVNFDNYGESSLNFFVYAMTKTTDWLQFHTIKEDVLLKIADIVAQHGATFAFPTRTLHVVSPDSSANTPLSKS